KTHGHRRIATVEQRVAAGKKLAGKEAIACGLRHTGAVYREHIGVHPVLRRLRVIARLGLGNLIGVVGSSEVHPPAMDVKLIAQVFAAHGRALNMPSWETDTPG